MADKVTCCPHCNTSFRITDSQLASAKGAVRCGSCLQVFRASDHLESNDTEESEYHNPEPFSPTAADTESTPQHDNLIDEDLVDDDNDLLISDDMDETASADDEFSAEFLVDSEAQQTQGSMFDRKIVSKTQEYKSADDDSWAEALLEEDNSERREPVFTITGEYPETEPEAAHTAEYKTSASDTEQTADLEPQLGDGQNESLPEQSPATSETQTQNREIINSIAEAPVEMEWHNQHSPWRKRLLWGGLNLALITALVLQIGWFNINTLSRQAPYRSYYQALCPTLGCEIPPSYDIALIKSYNLVVRSHPQAQNALAIDSILLNTAGFSQPFPKLTLVFSDIDNNPIAHRTFEPGEYLAGELAGATEMPSQRPIHIALEILDPGAEAVNYQLAIVGR